MEDQKTKCSHCRFSQDRYLNNVICPLGKWLCLIKRNLTDSNGTCSQYQPDAEKIRYDAQTKALERRRFQPQTPRIGSSEWVREQIKKGWVGK
jgi:hypothetical protein